MSKIEIGFRKYNFIRKLSNTVCALHQVLHNKLQSK